MQRRWMAALSGLGFSLLLSMPAYAAAPSEPPPAQDCTADVECGDGEICDDGYCGPKGDTCLTDDDCGQYTFCEAGDNLTTVDAGTAESTPSETEPDPGGAGSDSGEGSDGAPPSDGGDDWAPNEGPGDGANYIARGECVANPETIPEDATCRSICDQFAACIEVYQEAGSGSSEPAPIPNPDAPSGGGDSGSSETPSVPPSEDGAPFEEPQERDENADPVEPREPTDEERAGLSKICTLLCSYGAVTQPETAGALTALDTCLDAQSVCDGQFEGCQDELETLETLFDDGPDVPDAYDDFQRGEASGTNTEAASNPQGDSQTAGDQLGDDGCAGGPNPGMPWLLLIALTALVAVRRRLHA
ncbi:MAG: MYXO-CTERM domain-containing protein [Myxococcota bacterium]|jgi:MYXO-CTERM domain-containing protein